MLPTKRVAKLVPAIPVGVGGVVVARPASAGGAGGDLSWIGGVGYSRAATHECVRRFIMVADECNIMGARVRPIVVDVIVADRGYVGVDFVAGHIGAAVDERRLD